MKRDYTCMDCLVVSESVARRGFLPKRCKECTRKHLLALHKKYEQKTVMTEVNNEQRDSELQ